MQAWQARKPRHVDCERAPTAERRPQIKQLRQSCLNVGMSVDLSALRLHSRQASTWGLHRRNAGIGRSRRSLRRTCLRVYLHQQETVSGAQSCYAVRWPLTKLKSSRNFASNGQKETLQAKR